MTLRGVKGRTVICRGLYRTYDRVVAICHAGGIDLAGEFVRRGPSAGGRSRSSSPRVARCVFP